MNKFNNFFRKNIIIIFTIFLFMQPILDMITGIALYKFNVDFTISSVIRAVFLIFTLYYLVFVERKKINMKILIAIILYSIIFIFCNILFKENTNIIYEIKSLLNNIYLPISLLFMFLIFSNREFCRKKIYYVLLIYMIFVFVPNLFNIGFNSYSYSKEGSVGFFYSANAVGSLISIIAPLLISELVIERKKIYLILFLFMYVYILLTLGTKAPILCALIILSYYILYAFINLIKNKSYKKIIILFISFIAFLFAGIKLITITPFYDNLIIHLNFLKIKKISDLFTIHNIDHFLFGSRLSFFYKTFDMYLSSNIIQKLFGLGYYLNGKIMKLVEMDYLDIFLHQGIIGFIIILFTYFKTILYIFKSYFKKFKTNFLNIKKSSMIISIIISILCAFLTGHVLATPAVSIFISVILTIYYNEFKTEE